MAGAAETSRWVTLLVALPTALFFVSVKPNQIHWLGFALLIWAELSLLWTPVPYDGLFALGQMVLIGLAFLIGCGVDDARPIYRGMGIGLWISSGICILQFFGYSPVISQFVPSSLSMAWFSDVGAVYPSIIQATGLFVNPNTLGEISVLVLVALAVDQSRASLIIAAGVLPSLVLSECRSAMVAGTICAVLYALKRWSWRATAVIPILAVCVFALARFKWLHGALGEERISIWRDTWNGVSFFGNGVGSFVSAFPKFATLIDTTQVQPSRAHNDALQILFELGVPGFIIAALMAAMLLFRAQERERLALIAFGITAMFGFPLHNPATAFLVGIVAGHAARGWYSVRDFHVARRISLYPGRQSHDSGRIRIRSAVVSVRP